MSEEKPTVSVIIPTYNRAHLVDRAIQSVLNQTYHDFELIVVDDGSTDSTEEVVRSIKDPRIRYTRHNQNRGGSAARNSGIKMARGEYIAFQDSDDEWLPEKLDKQMRVFENAPAEVGVVYTDMWRIRGEEKKYWHSPIIRPEDGIVYKQALDRVMGIGIATAIIKRECFNVVGMFDESFPRFIDLELFIRLSKNYYFYHINEPLVNYYDTGKGISNNNEALIKAYELIFKKYSYDIVANKISLAKHQYVVGNLLCQSGALNHGREYLFMAVKSNPLNIKYLVAAFASLFGAGAYAKVVQLKRMIRPAEYKR
jgi:glycosyltransferase involved in cell wall biosynthesis